MSSQSVRGRGMGAYTEDGAARQPFVANLIDFRHSVVQAHKRADAGDESLEICAYCMCEVDVDPQPHRPGCAGIGQARATSSPVLAGLDPLSHSQAPKPSVVLGSARNGLDALERMDDGLPQEPELDLDVDEPDAEVLEEREPEVPVEPTSAPPAIEPPVAPSRSSSTTRKQTWTPELIVAAIRRWNDEHGAPPSVSQWLRKLDGYPTSSTCNAHFGSWSKAIAAAGFEPRARGGIRKAEAVSRVEASALQPTRPPRERPVTAEDDTDAARGEEASDETLIAATGAETPAPPSASPNADELVLGLTLEQLVAAGHSMRAIAVELLPLEKPDRRAVWEFIRPLIEEALDA